jgi:hypothetical protein
MRAYLPLIMTAVLLASIAMQILLTLEWRKTLALKDSVIAASILLIEAKNRELAAVKAACLSGLKTQQDVIQTLLAVITAEDPAALSSKELQIRHATFIGDGLINKLQREAAPPSFECPDCHRVSFNANDIEQRYCGACHAFFPPRRPFLSPGPAEPPQPPPDRDVSKGGA